MGNADQPDGVLDANDRVSRAYVVDGSGNLIFPSGDFRGDPLLVWPNRLQKLIVHVLTNSTKVHAWNVNNTVTATYMPRYRLGRGSM